jgi:hypothetical protein
MTKGASLTNKRGQSTHIPITAFADDTNLLGNSDLESQTIEQLVQEVQEAFTNWNGLLQASGHFMELSKCACYLMLWKFQEDGYMYTMDPKEHNQKNIVRDNKGMEHIILQLRSNETQKLLGVMKCPTGDQQDEVQRLTTKSNNIATRINTTKLSRAEA